MVSTNIHYRYTLVYIHVYTKDIHYRYTAYDNYTIQYKTYDGASKNDLPVFCSI